MIRKIKNYYHLFVAIAATIIFRYPGKKIKVIGVTGTDGKTTTVTLIHHILKESGNKSSMLSSIGAEIGNKKIDTGFHVTTPSSFKLQRLLNKAVRNDSEYFVLEVTSHAIDQYRIYGIKFDIGVLTNISKEHLDYHKTFEAYVRTKEKLLIMANKAIVNKDDISYKMLVKAKKNKSDSNWITYSLKNDSDVNSENFEITSKYLFGEFNKQNALAAVACVKELNISDEKIKKAINSFRLPKGRMDFVFDKEFTVLIDFAHTPNSFEKLLSSLKSEYKGNIIHVFGSAGERDHEKRSIMGHISSKYSNTIVLTSEDPRNEDVEEIINEIEDGISDSVVKLIRQVDRKIAIEEAIGLAKKSDLVVITGKAHEKSMNFDGIELPWDEYKVVNESIEKKLNKNENI